MINDVNVIIKENDQIIDINKYHAEFFGYSLEIAEFEQKFYNKLYGNKKTLIANEYRPHKLKISFIIDGFENTVDFSSRFDDVTFKFTDSSFIYQSIKSSYSYEYISGKTYQIDFEYECYIYSDKKTVIVKSDYIYIESAKPVSLSVQIIAKQNISNYLISLVYYDYYLKKNYQNDILIKELIKGHMLYINSDDFICLYDNIIDFSRININIYPITKGSIEIKGIDDSIEMKFIYRRQY